MWGPHVKLSFDRLRYDRILSWCKRSVTLSIAVTIFAIQLAYVSPFFGFYFLEAYCVAPSLRFCAFWMAMSNCCFVIASRCEHVWIKSLWFDVAIRFSTDFISTSSDSVGFSSWSPWLYHRARHRISIVRLFPLIKPNLLAAFLRCSFDWSFQSNATLSDESAVAWRENLYSVFFTFFVWHHIPVLVTGMPPTIQFFNFLPHFFCNWKMLSLGIFPLKISDHFSKAWEKKEKKHKTEYSHI